MTQASNTGLEFCISRGLQIRCAKENSTWETKKIRADSSAKVVRVNRTNRSRNSSSKTKTGVKIMTWKPTSSSVVALMATGKTRKESANALSRIPVELSTRQRWRVFF